MPDDDITDNILDDVRGAAAELGEGEGVDNAPAPPERVNEPATEGAPDTGDKRTAAERERDEAGRFAKRTDKPRETLTLKDGKPGAQDPSSQPQTTATKPETATTPQERPPPPAEFMGASKVQWDKLPAPIQQDIHRMVEGVQAARARIAPIEQALAPYGEAWTLAAGSVPQAFREFEHFRQLMLTNPRALVQHIERVTGIDAGQPAGQPPQGGIPQATDFASVIQQAVQQEVAPFVQQHQQMRSQQISEMLAGFASNPRFAYFNDAESDMMDLIAGAQAKGEITPHTPVNVISGMLEKFYDRATWANPTIRMQLIQAAAEEEKATQAAAVAKARQASAVSVRGSPLPGVNGSGGAGAGASPLDDARAAAQEIGFGA